MHLYSYQLRVIFLLGVVYMFWVIETTFNWLLIGPRWIFYCLGISSMHCRDPSASLCLGPLKWFNLVKFFCTELRPPIVDAVRLRNHTTPDPAFPKPWAPLSTTHQRATLKWLWGTLSEGTVCRTVHPSSHHLAGTRRHSSLSEQEDLRTMGLPILYASCLCLICCLVHTSKFCLSPVTSHRVNCLLTSSWLLWWRHSVSNIIMRILDNCSVWLLLEHGRGGGGRAMLSIESCCLFLLLLLLLLLLFLSPFSYIICPKLPVEELACFAFQSVALRWRCSQWGAASVCAVCEDTRKSCASSFYWHLDWTCIRAYTRTFILSAWCNIHGVWGGPLPSAEKPPHIVENKWKPPPSVSLSSISSVLVECDTLSDLFTVCWFNVSMFRWVFGNAVVGSCGGWYALKTSTHKTAHTCRKYKLNNFK